MPPRRLMGSSQQTQPHLRAVAKTIKWEELSRLVPCQGGERGRGQQEVWPQVRGGPGASGRGTGRHRVDLSLTRTGGRPGAGGHGEGCALGTGRSMLRDCWACGALAVNRAQRAANPEGGSEEALGDPQGESEAPRRWAPRRHGQVTGHEAEPRPWECQQGWTATGSGRLWGWRTAAMGARESRARRLPQAPLLQDLPHSRHLCRVCIRGDTSQIAVIPENPVPPQGLELGGGFRLEHQPRSPAADPEGEGRDPSERQEQGLTGGCRRGASYSDAEGKRRTSELPEPGAGGGEHTEGQQGNGLRPQSPRKPGDNRVML